MDHEITMSRKMATHSATKWILSIFSKKVLYVYDTLSSDNGFLRFLWDHCHSFCSYFHLAPPHPLILSSHFYRMSDSHKRANAKYYWKNREKCLQYAREYHQANIETIHEKKRLRPRPSRAKPKLLIIPTDPKDLLESKAPKEPSAPKEPKEPKKRKTPKATKSPLTSKEKPVYVSPYERGMFSLSFR